MSNPDDKRRYVYMRERFGREAYQKLKLFWLAAIVLSCVLGAFYHWVSD